MCRSFNSALGHHQIRGSRVPWAASLFSWCNSCVIAPAGRGAARGRLQLTARLLRGHCEHQADPARPVRSLSAESNNPTGAGLDAVGLRELRADDHRRINSHRLQLFRGQRSLKQWVMRFMDRCSWPESWNVSGFARERNAVGCSSDFMTARRHRCCRYR